MRIEDILQREMAGDLGGIHSARLQTIFAATCALLRCGKATLTSIGRAIASRTSHKHGIKRIDRLLGNDHLKRERVQIFAAIARRIIAPGSRPVVIVDWTDFDKKMWSLVAAVSCEGRAVIIYSETHPRTRYLKPAVHRAFLKKLRAVVPERGTPIIVTDAGFQTPWLKEVARLGWDYVCRLRGRTQIRESGKVNWSKLIHLFQRMGKGVRDFGICELARHTRKDRLKTRLIGFSKRRRSQNWNEGRMSKSEAEKSRRRAKEPWVLATSMKSSPNKIVAAYASRMQIEETFRDTKSMNLGFSLDHARTKSATRADILILLASLAHLLSIIAGLVAETCKLDRTYQANTVRTRRVLSLSKLGRLLLGTDRAIQLPKVALAAAWLTLSERIFIWSEPLI